MSQERKYLFRISYSRIASTTCGSLLKSLPPTLAIAKMGLKGKNGSFFFSSLPLKSVMFSSSCPRSPGLWRHSEQNIFLAENGLWKNQPSTLKRIKPGREVGSKGSILPQLEEDTRKVELAKIKDCAIRH